MQTQTWNPILYLARLQDQISSSIPQSQSTSHKPLAIHTNRKNKETIQQTDTLTETSKSNIHENVQVMPTQEIAQSWLKNTYSEKFKKGGQIQGATEY